MGLIRPQTQQLQTDSFIAVNSILNAMNCEFRRLEPDNAGIDGEIDLVKNSQFQGKLLKCQIKAGLSYISSENKDFIKIKIEKKYLELWATMRIPVLIFFYHPDTKVLYWKSVPDYLKIDPKILKKENKTVSIPFDKKRDTFKKDTYIYLVKVHDETFEYEKIIFDLEDKEKIVSNWFPIIDLPQVVYSAPTTYTDDKDIASQLSNYLPFLVKDKLLYTLSNLNNRDNELRNFCKDSVILQNSYNVTDHNYYVELLNKTIRMNLNNIGFITNMKGKFYFSQDSSNTDEQKSFTFKALRKKGDSERQKVYERREGKKTYYQHLGGKIFIRQIAENWFLEIEPDWHLSYPFNPEVDPRTKGAKNTRLKHAMYNQDYLYLLNALKSYITSDNNNIIFVCDNFENPQKITIEAESYELESNFTLFNDYNVPV